MWASFVQALKERGQLTPFVVLLDQAQCLQDQRLASGDILSAVDMEERDLFVTESCVGRVVFQFLLELVAEDEMALALVQVGGDEVFGAELEEDIIEFGRRGFGEGR